MAKSKRICLLLFRLLALVSTVSAAIIMANSHQTTTFLSISFEAKYTQMPSFKFFVIANIIASVYGLLVLFLPAESLLGRFVLCLDVVVMVVLASSISAALAVAEIGKKGNSYAGWVAVCDRVPKYCEQVSGAVAAGFAGLVIHSLIVLYSFHSFLDPFLLKKT